ncbi:FAD-binding oxidoreductase [Microlunatus soli]|uniref:FAD/FMN-containing dehydrogenase n=1 Tax=Microlunatus soli TaxID=630515 RepID=A0A1H2ALJ1_9ACTN|nr:FAD-binding oxidoreductase [Microlunatus soli]SDT46780.1 FAD/FMN-containing dehydrogenase [Microlunatus soli]
MSTQIVTPSRTVDRIGDPVVLFPGTDRYQAARADNTPDHYPAAIVVARTADDIRAGVRAAAELERPLAVRATGHGSVVAADGAVLISTAAMKKIIIDPVRRVARLQPGLRWAEVIAAAEPYGLSPTSGDFPGVGVAGFTTGGGVGWLARRYGYAADNLISATMVLPDGRTVTASADEHPDLFWAVRGGSGNFGLITELEIRLVPVSRVLAGSMVWPIDRAAAVLRWFADHAEEVPDEVTLAPVLRREQSGPVLSVGFVAVGDPERAVVTLNAMRWAGRTGIAGVDGVRSEGRLIPYGRITIPGTRPLGFEMYHELSDQLIDVSVGAIVDGTANALQFHHWGGATARPEADHGPVGHRQIPFSIKIDAEPGVLDHLAWSATGAKFLNFLSDTSQTARAYRVADYYRLRELKRRYDPANVLRVNHNIPPA